VADQCFRPLQGIALRSTLVDACGVPVIGAHSTVVSESFVRFNAAPEVEDPDEFTVKTANGRLCLSEIGCPTLKRMNLTIEVCRADPRQFEMMAGATLVLDADDNAVGYKVTEDFGNCPAYAVEIWSRIPVEECGVEGTQQWVYFLFPYVTNGRLGEVTIENGPVSFTVNGETKSTAGWGVGPYNVIEDGGIPSPLLDPIVAGDHYLVQLTTLAPPTETCGATALSALGS